MRRNSLFGLGLAAVAAVVLAIVLVGREASENQTLDSDERMFAELLGRANDVSIIEVVSGIPGGIYSLATDPELTSSVVGFVSPPNVN